MNETIDRIRTIGIATSLLIAVNLLCFVPVFFGGGINDGGYMLAHGAMNAQLVQQGQWYRLLTACFMHFDGIHLFNNMLILGVVGQYIERHIGSIKTLLLYAVAGICGNLVSMWMEIVKAEDVVSVGASGAVFGMVGALLALALHNKGRIDGLTLPRIFIMIGLSLYAGFSTSGVNNAAHVGGLTAGFLFTFLVYRQEDNHEEIIDSSGYAK